MYNVHTIASKSININNLLGVWSYIIIQIG